jgi:quercetin dioxygenase-like cupin family protein
VIGSENLNNKIMETELYKIKTPLRRKERTNNSSLNTFDLPAIIADLKNKQTQDNTYLKTRVLLKSPEKQIVLTALHEDTEIDSFQANDAITFQIMEGKVMLNTRKIAVTLGKGQLFTIHENINYKLTTKEETVLLLTITGSLLQNVLLYN